MSYFVIVMFAGASEAAAAQLFEVAISKIEIAAGERVVAFEIVVQAARIHSLREVPYDWHLTIDNLASLSAQAKGTIHHGAGAVDPDFLDKLLVIERREFNGLKLSIEMRVYVTADFATTREVILRTEDFLLVAR